MILKKVIEVVKEIPSGADPKKWFEEGWVEVKKERPKAKPKPKVKKKKVVKKKK